MFQSLQYVALAVPDLGEGKRFFGQMGLEAQAVGDHLVFRCPGRAQDQVRLIPGAVKRLAWVSFGASAAGVADIREALESAGMRVAEAPLPERAESLWFYDVDGDLIEVRVADDTPQSRAPVSINNPGESRRRLGQRGAPDRKIEARPRRLGHILKFSRDLDKTIEFYTSVAGMKVSDRIANAAAFLRFGGDSDHHTLALAVSEGTGLHHMSFEMGNVDQIQFCANRMIAEGYKDGWGFGRHIYGSNYFHYIRDPWNGLVEFFWDMDFVPGEASWECESGEPGDESLYQWATSPPPDDFLTNYERRQAV